MESPSGSVSWEVLLPERRASSLSNGAKPKAILLVTTEERGEERINVPLVVGKTVQAKADAGELGPQSRAELLFEVRELSMRCAALRIESLVDKRDYSAQELDQKLLLDGYPASVRAQAVARAQDCGLVNDDRYAAAFIRSKLSSGWGTMRIERELKRRGIELGDVRGWPEDFLEGDSEDDRAYEVAKTRRLSNVNGFEKLVRFLMNRGFSMGCAVRVARRVVDEQEAC